MIDIQNLSTRINSSIILDDISFQVYPADFWSIIGPNGAGKTTLLRCLTNYYNNWKGTIEINQKDISRITRKELSMVLSLVPQNFLRDFDFNVEELVCMGRTPYLSILKGESDSDIQIVKNSLKEVGILNLANRRYSTLSGGEKQLVGIAMCLAQQTPVILLDEPTSHLDPYYQTIIMEIFQRRNKKENITILSVFHNLNLALRYSNKSLLIDDGRVVALGNTEDVITEENIMKVFKINVKIEKINGQSFILTKGVIK